MTRRALTLGITLVMLGCGGGGGRNPVEATLSVSGLWIVTSTLLENTCGIDLPQISTFSLTITQSGSTLTMRLESPGQDIVYTGTIDSRTGDFTVSVSITESELTFTDIISGRFNSNTRFSSQSRTTVSDGTDSCLVRSMDEGQRQ